MSIELSVVIPSHNGGTRLRKCLDSLSRQTLSPDSYEAVVVVDGSTDNTRGELGKISTPFRVTTIEQQRQGAGASRNAGAKVAQGPICVFLDDDIVAEPQLLAEHLAVQRTHGLVVGLGAIPTVVPAHAGWLERRYAEYSNEHRAKLARGTRAPNWRDCYSGNMSIARETFLSVGGFATDMARGEDVELGYRLAERGIPFVYIPGAVGTEEQRKGMPELVSDFEANAVAAAEIYRRHPQTLPSVIPDFAAPGTGPVWLRRLLLTIGISPRILGSIAPPAGRKSWIGSWYNFIHSYCYWRGLRRGLDSQHWWQLMRSTPILCYRSVRSAERPESREVVSIAGFKRHLAWLRLAGYRVLDLDEYLRYRREYRVLPRRTVVITLDPDHRAEYFSADSALLKYASELPPEITPAYDSTAESASQGSWRANNHRTPLESLHRTEIRATDSLFRFAWKVSQASRPGSKRSPYLLRVIHRRLAQTMR